MDPLYAREVVATYPGPSHPSLTITGSAAAVLFMRGVQPRALVNERFIVLALDSRKRVISWSEIARGQQGSVVVDRADVYRYCLLSGGVAFLLAHNHPSGDPAPSGADRELTDRIVQGGALVGLRFLDHVILGAESHYSFLDSGYDMGAEAPTL